MTHTSSSPQPDLAGHSACARTPRCPIDHAPARAAPTAHTDVAAPAPAPTWPPGPHGGWTGWRLLREMSRDAVGALQRWQQAHGDLFHLRMWPEHVVVVAEPALARELLVAHHDALIRWERGTQVFSQIHGQSVLVAEGEAWQQQRRALQPRFAPKAVQAFVPTIVEATTQALSAWPRESADFAIEPALTALTMDVIVRQMCSARADADTRAVQDAVALLGQTANQEMYWPLSPPRWWPGQARKRQALTTLRRFIGGHIEARLTQAESAWPNDLLTALLQLHRHPAPGEPAWPLQAVHDECMTAFLAGHETTAATLTWWAACMAAHPDAQRRAADEVASRLGGRPMAAGDLAHLPWLTQTIQEALRLYPSVPILQSRRATRPIALGGHVFPARTLFMLPVVLMQHDARWYPNPHAFRPERFADDALTAAQRAPRGAWMPFGTGPRVCLGQHLATAEMQAICALLLQRWQWSPAAHQAPPQPMLNVTWRPREPLRVALAPRV